MPGAMKRMKNGKKMMRGGGSVRKKVMLRGGGMVAKKKMAGFRSGGRVKSKR